jgi:Cu(I)/Ag(I) efflux system membrane fusion protein
MITTQLVQMKRWQITLVLLISLWCTACTQSNKQENTAQTEVEGAATTEIKPAYATSNDFQKKLNGVTDAYLATKDALVASDAAQASLGAANIISRLQEIDASSLAEEAQQKWTTHKDALQRAAETLQAAEKLDEKRTHFETLSQTMYTVVQDFGSETTLYKEYCPMAFDDKGAFWLSAQSDIKNPYFGDAMLTCGEVQEVLKTSN